MKGQDVLFSSQSDEWETPQDFYELLDHEFHFTLDPCSTHANHKCFKYYTKEEDGLGQSWEGEVVFINPPHSRVKSWVEKAYVESVLFNVTCVLLLPARTDTKWFHTFLYNVPNAEIRFIKGRLKFTIDGKPIVNKNGQVQSAPFPSMVAILK